MSTKTGRYRLAPNGDCVALQIEMRGIFGPQQRIPCTRWVWATPQDLADLVTVSITPATIHVGAA